MPKARILSLCTRYGPMPVVPSMNEGMASTLVPKKRLKVVTRMVERAIQTIIVRLKSAFMGLNREPLHEHAERSGDQDGQWEGDEPRQLGPGHQQIAAVGGCHEDGAVGQVEYSQQVEDERESHAHEDVDHRSRTTLITV